MLVSAAVDLIEDKLDDSANKFYAAADIKQMLYICEISIINRAKKIASMMGSHNSLVHNITVTEEYLDYGRVDYVFYTDGSVGQVLQSYISRGTIAHKLRECSPEEIFTENKYSDYYFSSEKDDAASVIFVKHLTEMAYGDDGSSIAFIANSPEYKAIGSYTTMIIRDMFVYLAIDLAVSLMRKKDDAEQGEILKSFQNIDKVLSGTI